MKLQKTTSSVLSLDLKNYEELRKLGHGSFGVVKLV